MCPQTLAVAFVEWICDFGSGRRGKGGAPSLSTVPPQSELTDCQNAAVNIHQRSVHSVVFVRKDSQQRRFIGQIVSIFFRIALPYPDQYHHAHGDPPDGLSVDVNLSLGNSLNDTSHGWLLLINGCPKKSMPVPRNADERLQYTPAPDVAPTAFGRRQP